MVEYYIKIVKTTDEDLELYSGAEDWFRMIVKSEEIKNPKGIIFFVCKESFNKAVEKNNDLEELDILKKIRLDLDLIESKKKLRYFVDKNVLEDMIEYLNDSNTLDGFIEDENEEYENKE